VVGRVSDFLRGGHPNSSITDLSNTWGLRASGGDTKTVYLIRTALADFDWPEVNQRMRALQVANCSTLCGSAHKVIQGGKNVP
jgi:hypothetical protein